MLLFFVLNLSVMDLLSIGLLKFVVLLHHLIFIVVIYVNIDHLFTLFYGLILVF